MRTRNRTWRPTVEILEGRYTPSASFDAPVALPHLSAGLDQVGIVGPTDRVSPVFALNFDSPSTDTLFALNDFGVNPGDDSSTARASMPWQPDTGVTWGITNGHEVTGTSVPPGLLIPAVTYRTSFGYVVVRQS